MSAAHQNPPPVDPGLLARCLDVLRREPAGIITDIDGTISEIAPRPEEATVGDPARQALIRLTERLAFVGVVTGRAALAGETLVGVPELVYVGNHGMERRHRGAGWDHPEAVTSVAAIHAALEEIEAAMLAEGRGEGILFEDKRLSGSIHYRLAPDPLAARDRLLRLANEAAARHNLVVTEGRFIVEMRPKAVINKGTAVTDIVRDHGLRGVIFLGDDLTDVDAFRAVRVLRELGEIAGLRVGVRAAETQPEVLAECDVTVDGVPACVALLARIAEALEAREPASHAGHAGD